MKPFITTITLLTLLTLILTPLFVTPTLVLADEHEEDTGLVTCSGPRECDACALVTTIDEVLDWLITIMLVIFAIVVVYAGIRLVTSGGSPDAKSSAKTMMTNAIIGIVIVLAAWILVDTLMRALLPGTDGELEFNGITTPWNALQCTPTIGPAEVTGPTKPVVRENQPPEIIDADDLPVDFGQGVGETEIVGPDGSTD